jgi:hypothetical protein
VRGLGVVTLDAARIGQHPAQAVLRLRIAKARGAAVQLRGPHRIARHALAVLVVGRLLTPALHLRRHHRSGFGRRHLRPRQRIQAQRRRLRVWQWCRSQRRARRDQAGGDGKLMAAGHRAAQGKHRPAV